MDSKVLIYVLLLTFTAELRAQFKTPQIAPVVYKGETIYELALQGRYVYDALSELTFTQAAAQEGHAQTQSVPLLEGGGGAHWIIWRVKSHHRENLLLQISNPTLDEVSFFAVDTQGRLLHSHTAGLSFPYIQRDIAFQDYTFTVPSAEHPEIIIFLRLKSQRQILLPVQLGSMKHLGQNMLRKDYVFGIYTGIILVMFLYNLFVYFAVRDTNYLLYIFYIFSVGLTQLVLNGYGQRFLWPSDIFLAEQSINWSGILSGLGVLFFVKYFLKTQENAPWFDWLLHVFGIAYSVAFVLSVADYRIESYNLINAVAVFGSLSLMGAAIQIARKGYRPARFFLIAFSFFLMGVVVFVLRDGGLLPYNLFTSYALVTGSAIEVVLLSLALADRINMLTIEKEEARAHELETLRLNESLILEQNITLEKNVEERTRDLSNANKELSVAMNNLKNAQTQLVNAEKMASLGQLTAGIAHEINNPINFVSANINPLRRDIDDLKKLVNQYEELAKNCSDPKMIEEMKALRETLDIKITTEEIEDLMQGIHEGALRTSEIVKSLRNFSRLDEDDSKFANIHDGLDSTLAILRNQLKGNIVIVKNYDPNMGPIECYPGKLNQVFSNLIINAIQAIRTDPNRADGKIEITTYWGDTHVEIRVKDNGPGMPEKIKDRIFEPFFTTKEVGEGTGLGLSIVYSIIDAHRGKIEVESSVGRGTVFCITLPKTIY